jgi:WD40 repeat protein
VAVWNCREKTGKYAVSFGDLDHGVVMSVEVSRDGSRCATGHTDGSVLWWDVETGDLLRTLKPEGDHDQVHIVTVSSDKHYIVSGSTLGIVQIWAAETGEDLHGQMKGHTDGINEVAFSPDGSWLVSGSEDCTIRLWDTSNGADLKTMVGHRSGI